MDIELKTTLKDCEGMVGLMGDEGTVRSETAHDALQAHRIKPLAMLCVEAERELAQLKTELQEAGAVAKEGAKSYLTDLGELRVENENLKAMVSELRDGIKGLQRYEICSRGHMMQADDFGRWLSDQQIQAIVDAAPGNKEPDTSTINCG